MRAAWRVGISIVLASMWAGASASGDGGAKLSLTKVGETYRVDRDALTQALEAEIARVQAGERSDFSAKSGALVVKASHPGCALHVLKIPDGAVLRTIGGQPVHSADDFARETTAALSRATRSFEIEIDAAGRSLTLAYAFRAPAEVAGQLDLSSLREVGPGHYSIDRAVLTELLSNGMLLATMARAVPAIRNGAPIGFKLFAIRRASLFARLGLLNEDIVMAVNGKPISTPEDALAVYTTLRDASEIDISGERRAAPFTTKITLR